MLSTHPCPDCRTDLAKISTFLNAERYPVKKVLVLVEEAAGLSGVHNSNQQPAVDDFSQLDRLMDAMENGELRGAINHRSESVDINLIPSCCENVKSCFRCLRKNCCTLTIYGALFTVVAFCAIAIK